MSKKNVMLVGVSGAGKSTLINGVNGIDIAEAGKGSAVSKKNEKYILDTLPFDLIDSRGFEYNHLNQMRTMANLKKDLNKGMLEDNTQDLNNSIECIWYCVAATDGRLHKESIRSLKRIIRNWKNIPVIVVLTKSYSDAEKEENIQMVRTQFEKFGEGINLFDVIPVVAKEYQVGEFTVPESGLEELKLRTIDALASAENMDAREIYQRKQKRLKSQIIVNGASIVAGGVGAVPIPFPDGMILVPLETGMIKKIGSLYGFSSENGYVSQTFEMLITAGSVGTVARLIITGLKAVPAINIAASALNAITAATIVELLGQTCIVLFDKIDEGELDITRMEEIRSFIDQYISENANGFVTALMEYLNKADKSNKTAKKDISVKEVVALVEKSNLEKL